MVRVLNIAALKSWSVRLITHSVSTIATCAVNESGYSVRQNFDSEPRAQHACSACNDPPNVSLSNTTWPPSSGGWRSRGM